jgi:hypothetical protein
LGVGGISSPAVSVVAAHLDLDMSRITTLGSSLGENQDVKSRAKLSKVLGDVAR